VALKIEWQSDRESPSLTPLIVASLAVHAGLAALSVLAPHLLPRRIPQAPIIIVDMVSLPDGGAGPLEAPHSAPPPQARRKEEPPPVPPKAASKTNKPDTIKLPDPKTARPAKTEAKPVPEPQAATPPAVAPTPAPPDAPAGPAAGVGGAGAPGFGEQKGGGIGALDAEQFEYAWYRAALTQKLRGTWAKPSMPDITEPLRTLVYFKVRRNGQIFDVQLESASGNDLLDRSAMRAVYESSPLPPLPYAYKEDSLGVHFFFELVPE